MDTHTYIYGENFKFGRNGRNNRYGNDICQWKFIASSAVKVCTSRLDLILVYSKFMDSRVTWFNKLNSLLEQIRIEKGIIKELIIRGKLNSWKEETEKRSGIPKEFPWTLWESDFSKLHEERIKFRWNLYIKTFHIQKKKKKVLIRYQLNKIRMSNKSSNNFYTKSFQMKKKKIFLTSFIIIIN